MKDKIVVLDTNVLLHDPEAPHRFGDLRVVIPMQVVEEKSTASRKITLKKAGMPEEFRDSWIPTGPAEASLMAFPLRARATAYCR